MLIVNTWTVATRSVFGYRCKPRRQGTHGVINPLSYPGLRRGAGVVEQAGLENRNTGNGIVGSNPTLSAILPLMNLLMTFDGIR
jgi:hypothetical protein